MPSNIIGGKHQISKNLWALSLVRKVNMDHAYLILEGMDEKDEKRIVMDAHLVIKEGTNNKKALIIRRELNIDDAKTADELEAIGRSCSAYTWSISKERANAFIALVDAEKGRDINYRLPGDAPISNLAFASLASSESKPSEDGENCASWAIKMIKAMQLKFTADWTSFILVRPKYLLQGQHDGNKEPTSGEKICLVM